MKTTATILIIALLAIGANFLCDGCNEDGVTKAYFEERISEVETKIDSLVARVGIIDVKVDRLQSTADSTHSAVKANGQKLDEIKAELDEVKTTTQNIQFRLF